MSTWRSDFSEFQETLVYPTFEAPRPITARAMPTDTFTNILVLVDTPYIHQVWSTAKDFHGSWACLPTSLVIALVAAGVLKAAPHPAGIAYYVSEPFVFGDLVFDQRKPTRQGSSVRGFGQGIYGATIDIIGNGYGGHVYEQPKTLGALKLIKTLAPHLNPDFFSKPKDKGGRFMEQGPFEELVRKQLDKGLPVIVSTNIRTPTGKYYDHVMVIVGLYIGSDGEIHYICHDPFGLQASGQYDGKNVGYSIKELRPKYIVVLDA